MQVSLEVQLTKPQQGRHLVAAASCFAYRRNTQQEPYLRNSAPQHSESYKNTLIS